MFVQNQAFAESRMHSQSGEPCHALPSSLYSWTMSIAKKAVMMLSRKRDRFIMSYRY